MSGRFCFCLLFAISLRAQDPQVPAPVPAQENWLTGTIDLGYRWRTGIGGSVDTYRSIVNLGSGPKLISADFIILDPSRRLFDRLNVRALNVGDEPSASWHVDASKKSVYRFVADYRNIAYFNNLPSYADPLLSTTGLALNEQSFDTHRRMANVDVDLLPGSWLTPYLSYNRNSGYGSGVTTFVSDANEYAVPSRLNDGTNQFRAGVRIERRRFHITLEQGGTTFRDDENIFATPGTNLGNRTTPLLGNTLSLQSLVQDDGVRGNSVYSKGLATVSAAPWLDLYGQFLYSEPTTDVHYAQYNTGQFVALSQLLFFTSQQYLLSAQAKLPHTSASAGFELRPLRRMRVVESWFTDRLHQSGSTLGSQSYNTGLVNNYSRQQLDVFYELNSRITLRGGYRYSWGDGNQFLLPADALQSSDQGRYSQNVGVGGISFRGGQRLSIYADVEGGTSEDAYFRTSLHNYEKLRTRAHYQLTGSLDLSSNFSFVNNQNPAAGVHYEYQLRQESATVSWTPDSSKRWSVQASYDRSALRSDIQYLVPQDLSSTTSSYRDNGHSLSGLVDGTLPIGWGVNAKVLLGGSAFISSGSRPTSFYRPVAKVSIPLTKSVTWFAEWTYYGFGESFYQYEGFHAHLLTTGLRLTR